MMMHEKNRHSCRLPIIWLKVK
jgi:hypothetical protein